MLVVQCLFSSIETSSRLGSLYFNYFSCTSATLFHAAIDIVIKVCNNHDGNILHNTTRNTVHYEECLKCEESTKSSNLANNKCLLCGQ